MPTKGAHCKKCCCDACHVQTECSEVPDTGCCRCLPKPFCVETKVTVDRNYSEPVECGSDYGCNIVSGKCFQEFEGCGGFSGTLECRGLSLPIELRPVRGPEPPCDGFYADGRSRCCWLFQVGDPQSGCGFAKVVEITNREVAADDPYQNPDAVGCREFEISGEFDINNCDGDCVATATVTVRPADRFVNPLSKHCDGCTNCRCVCECLCITYTDDDGCSESVKVCSGDGSWSVEFDHSYENPDCSDASITVAIVKDEYSGDCVLSLSGTIDGEEIEDSDTAALGYPDMDCTDIDVTWTATKYNGSTVTIRAACAKCGECQEGQTNCCPDNFVPQTLIATLVNMRDCSCTADEGRQIPLHVTERHGDMILAWESDLFTPDTCDDPDLGDPVPGRLILQCGSMTIGPGAECAFSLLSDIAHGTPWCLADLAHPGKDVDECSCSPFRLKFCDLVHLCCTSPMEVPSQGLADVVITEG